VRTLFTTRELLLAVCALAIVVLYFAGRLVRSRSAVAPVASTIQGQNTVVTKQPRKATRRAEQEIIAEDTVTYYRVTPSAVTRPSPLESPASPIVPSASLSSLMKRLPQPLPPAPPALEPTGPQTYIWYRAGNSIFLTAQDVTLTLRRPELYGGPETWIRSAGKRGKGAGATIRLRLVGADPSAVTEARGAHVNLSKGFSEVRFASIYPGVDILYQSDPRQLRYSFVLSEAADPSAIRLGFGGAAELRLANGKLLLKLPYGEMQWQPPQLYRETPDGKRIKLPARYVLTAPTLVTIESGPPAKSAPASANALH
jgi:hypothetical protein